MSDAPILAPAPEPDPSAPGGEPVPLTLLTGFLGAGKTTLLNRILGGDHGLRIGVLVNDFGSINIDASLVESSEEHTVSLANGCVCCEIRDDLVTSIEELLDRNRNIEHVVLEASGVADPAGIVMTLVDTRYRNLVSIDSITCVVDAEAIFADGDDEALAALKLRQIAFADLVVVNKSDLVSRAHLDVVRDWIDLHLQRIRIVEAIDGDVPLDILLGVGRYDGTPDRRPPESPPAATDVFERWSFETTRPLDRTGLEHMIKRRLPGSVYRCKGIVYTGDPAGVPHALQVVGRRCSLTPRAPSDTDEGVSRIVAIGRAIDSDALDELFESCCA